MVDESPLIVNIFKSEVGAFYTCSVVSIVLLYFLFFGANNLFWMFWCDIDHGYYIVGNTEYAEEPATNVKFQTSLSLPGCSTLLSLIGTG